MADAVAAFKEAFSSYRQNAVDFCIYSVLMGLANGFLTFVLLAAFTILGVLSAGSALSIAGAGGGLSLTAAGIFATLMVVALGFLIFLWLEAGLTGAYLETLNTLSSGRKQTLFGFFGLIPKRATPILGIWLVLFLLVFVPMVGVLAIPPVFGQIGSLALLGLWGLISAVIGFLFFFAMPAAVLDGRGIMSSIKASFVASGRNAVAVTVYTLVSLVLALPGIILMLLGIGILYVVLLYLPVSQLALLLLYKKCK